MTTITVHITKDVLEASKYCANGALSDKTGQNCAIGKAIVSLFPNSWVGPNTIFFCPKPIDFSSYCDIALSAYARVSLPEIACKFIAFFDDLTPEQRVSMPEISFDIEVPDSVIDRINIDEVRRIINECPSLSLVE